MAERQVRSAVGQLILRQVGKGSVAEYERQKGLAGGTLAYYLRPTSQNRSRRAGVPKIKQLAEALGSSIEEVSEAFAVDSGLCALTEESLTAAEKNMIADFRRLSPTSQAAWAAAVAAFAEAEQGTR
ncbi:MULTISPECIES: hypothetical protein [unclassified Crossiella]|uniref:hypothetical protein n=1 Tax=unclassified Crossiella TaxID=2620835 RepID=UPI001FFEF1AF|nr:MULTISPECIES: hypothetical protein [unclassified Crossiella]MCK2242340.1 hypothetical protein [Crossiella sp. S99.2]MCK2254629.1 hypothetical protein [Crossiella sp. S99.1]